ncbi:hypothetical protein VNO77_06813 [Canavalia gladiata]|uniref:S-protein homolog n=1 Tax=Canavalia gladiata TaxID=3824 RepID=A0AAN9M7T5_CANGL
MVPTNLGYLRRNFTQHIPAVSSIHQRYFRETIVAMKQVLLLVIFVAFWEASSAVANPNTGGEENGFNPMPKTTVRVRNLLGEGLTLIIHCKSKNDDLGPHLIQPNDTYEWSFHRNFFGRTLFFCGIHWIHGSIVYDIYKTSRDFRRCSTDCYWEITNKALYGYTQVPQELDIEVPWPAPKK